jgi:class 3 adenylate cyclase
MFIDMVESTSLSSQLDPEDLREGLGVAKVNFLAK